MLNFLKSKEKKKQEVRQMYPVLKRLEEADAEFLDFVKQSGEDTTEMEKYFKDMEEKYYEPFLCRMNHKDFKIEGVEDYPEDEFEEYEPYSSQLDTADYFMMKIFYPDLIKEIAALWQSTMSMDIAIYYLCKKIKEADDPEQFVKENHNLIRLTAMQIRSDAAPRYEHLMRAFYVQSYSMEFVDSFFTTLNCASIILDSYIYKYNIPVGTVVTTPDGIDRMITPKVPKEIYKYHVENKYNKFDWTPEDDSLSKTELEILDKTELSSFALLAHCCSSFLSISKSAAILQKDTSMEFMTRFLNNPSFFNCNKINIDEYIPDAVFDPGKTYDHIHSENLLPLENALYDFCSLVTPERYNSDTDENNMTEQDIKEVTKGLLKIYDTLVKYWSKFPEYKE